MRRMNVALIFTALFRAESGGRYRKALQPKICAPRKNTLALINTHFFLSKYPYSKKRRGWRGYKGLVYYTNEPIQPNLLCFSSPRPHFAQIAHALARSTERHYRGCVRSWASVNTFVDALRGHKACQNSRLMKANEVLCAWNPQRSERVNQEQLITLRQALSAAHLTAIGAVAKWGWLFALIAMRINPIDTISKSVPDNWWTKCVWPHQKNICMCSTPFLQHMDKMQRK